VSYIMVHFTERELACKHCGTQGCTDELKQALDQYRKIVGLPVIVQDAFRCNEHNAVVSLVSKSQHPVGTAADIAVPGLTLQEMYNAALRVPIFCYGGIGVYDKNFIHVDVRHSGIARWAFVGSKELPVSILVSG
jgi:zinc D-Ala-D-Ala carboxypeptidase